MLERLQSLESSLSSRRQVQDSVQTSTAWLDSMHDRIKAADGPTGPSTQHAHDSLQQLEVRGALMVIFCMSALGLVLFQICDSSL